MKTCPFPSPQTEASLAPHSVGFTVAEIALLNADLNAYNTISSWTQDYLAQPNSKLGRPGPVCPFTPEALLRDTLHIKVVRFVSDPPREIEQAVMAGQRAFMGLEPTGEGAIYKAILLVFPDVELSEAPVLIDATKERLKPSFVNSGLMLGEFHESNVGPGLHNDEFQPLRSPIPMLVIRFMVSSDLVFLNRESDPPAARALFLSAYLKHQVLRPAEREKVEKILADVKKVSTVSA